MNDSQSSAKEIVAFYVKKMHANQLDLAFHGLIESKVNLVPEIIAAFHRESSPSVRHQLCSALWSLKTSEVLPFMQRLLREKTSDSWKQALDGLVTSASTEAIGILEAALKDEQNKPNPNREYLEWVEDALEQTRQSFQTSRKINIPI